MKKILFLLLSSFLFFSSQAQAWTTNNLNSYIRIQRLGAAGPVRLQIDSAANGTWKDLAIVNNVFTFPSVATMRASNFYTLKLPLYTVSGYYSPGDKGGGYFYWSDTCTHADDSTFFFKPAGGGATGRYVRIIEGSTINIRWGGAKADGYYATATSGNSFDNLPVVNRILNYIEASQGVYNQIYFPMSNLNVSYNGGYGYFFSGQINVKTPVRLYGDPGNSTPATIMVFNNTGGIYGFAPNVPQDGGRGTIQWDAENFWVYASLTPSAQADGTNYGMYSDTKCNWKNIRVENFKGHGFFIHGGTQAGGGWYTVADNWDMLDCISVKNAGDGLYVLGEDANVGYCRNFIAKDNKYWGVKDSSNLGNMYYTIQLNNNGVYGGGGNDTRAKVKVIGTDTTYYLAKQDNTNQAPTYAADNAYWSYLGGAGLGHGNDLSTPWVWNSSTTYPGAGAFTTIGNANKCSIFGMYTEFGQTHTILNGVTVNIGGYQGTTVKSGMYVSALGGDMTNITGLQLSGSLAFSSGGVTGGVISYNGSQFTQTYSKPTHQVMGDNFYFDYPGGNLFHLNFATGHMIWGNNAFDEGEPYIFSGGNLLIRSGSLMLYNIQANGFFNHINYANAAPTTGSWTRGDICFNTTPTIGAVLYWRCTATGSPGTWEAVSAGGGGGTGTDTFFVVNKGPAPGTGVVSLAYIGVPDTIYVAKLQQGANILVTKNADSSVTIAHTTSGVSGSSCIACNLSYDAQGHVTTAASSTTVATGLTGAGTNQGTALVLSGDNSLQEVTTTASGTGVKLPTAKTTSMITVVNRGINTLTVYPATSGVINGQATNAGYQIASGGTATFYGLSTTSWYTQSRRGGDVNDGDGTGTLLLNSIVSAGSCTSCNITFDSKGRATSFSNGAGGGSLGSVAGQQNTTPVGARDTINFKSGSNMTPKITDSAANKSINVQFNLAYDFMTNFGNRLNSIPMVSNNGAGGGFNSTFIPYVAGIPGGFQGFAGTTTTGFQYVAFADAGLYFDNTSTITNRSRWENVKWDGPSATNAYELLIGFVNGYNTQVLPTNGCYFKYSDTLNTAKWILECAANGSFTDNNTSTTADFSNPHTYEVSVFQGVATFYIDGTSIGTVSTGLPNGSSQRFNAGYYILKQSGTTDVGFQTTGFKCSWHVE